MIPRITAVATVLVLMASACGGSDDSSPAAAVAASASAAVSSPAATTATGSSAAPASLDGLDPCSVLTTDEVGPLVPQPSSKPVDQGPGQIACRWEGSDTSQGPPPDLVFVVKTGADQVPLNDLKLALTAEAKEHGKVVDGLGDFGIVTSTIAGQASVTAIKGPLLVTLDLSANGAENQQDPVAALAKVAMGRLP